MEFVEHIRSGPFCSLTIHFNVYINSSQYTEFGLLRDTNVDNRVKLMSSEQNGPQLYLPAITDTFLRIDFIGSLIQENSLKIEVYRVRDYGQIQWKG